MSRGGGNVAMYINYFLIYHQGIGYSDSDGKY